MTGVCYKSGCEWGAWFELLSIRNAIAGKEARGESAAFERMLYKAWLKIPEYVKADKENRAKGFYGDLAVVPVKREGVAKIISDVNHSPPNYATSSEAIVTAPRRPRGRRRKMGEVHRTTDWRRRRKELQGVLPL